jgi:hypothetical protein
MTSGKAGGLLFAGPSKGPDRKQKNQNNHLQADAPYGSVGQYFHQQHGPCSWNRQTLGVHRQSRGFTYFNYYICAVNATNSA